MLSYQLFVVLSIITIGLTIPVTKSLSNEKPERCCVPKQYSSKISLSTGMVLPDGKVYTSYASYNFSYDQTRGMIGMKGVVITLPEEQQTKLWIIENMNDGQIYTIDLDTKRCDKSINPIKAIQCIPQSAIYINSLNYGYGDKQIIGDTWLVKMNETISYSTVSRGDCVPLTGHLFIQQLQMMDTLTTTDFVPHIDDPSVFDIPPECLKLV